MKKADKERIYVRQEGTGTIFFPEHMGKPARELLREVAKRRKKMKISDARGSMFPEINGRKGDKSKTNGAFRKVMSEVMERQEGKSAQPFSVNSPELSPNISPAQMIRGVEGRNGILSGAQVMNELQSALDLAGFYTRKLGDPAVKTASLEPLVTHLEEKLEGLRFLKEQGNMNEKLKGIVSELDLALGTEVARFRRGDYY